MSPSDREREQDLLRALLAGDVSPADEQVRSALAASPELRAEWEAMRETQAQLEAEDREREAILHEVAASPGDPREDEVVDGFRRLASGVPPSSASARPRRGLPLVLLVAAALALIAIWLPWSSFTRHADPGGGPILGEVARIELERPIGGVTSYDRFTWRPPAVPVDSYRVLILRRDDDGALHEVKVVSRLRATSYLPDELLPPRIVWRVLGYDRLGALVAKGEAEASLAVK